MHSILHAIFFAFLTVYSLSAWAQEPVAGAETTYEIATDIPFPVKEPTEYSDERCTLDLYRPTNR